MAGHFGLRTRTTLAGWFPAYDTSFAKYSPGLIHHLAMAEKAAEAGIQVIDMGRGEKEYKEKLKNGEYEVAEGRVATAAAPAPACTGCSGCPVRKARATVLANPLLHTTADRALKTFGRLRTALPIVRRSPAHRRTAWPSRPTASASTWRCATGARRASGC